MRSLHILAAQGTPCWFSCAALGPRRMGSHLHLRARLQGGPWSVQVCHCSSSLGCQAAHWDVPGQPVSRSHLHRGHVRGEPAAGRVHCAPLLGHSASVRSRAGGGDPGAGVPDAGLCRVSAFLAARDCSPFGEVRSGSWESVTWKSGGLGLHPCTGVPTLRGTEDQMGDLG